MRDAWRLAVGTFTALRTAPPRHVDDRVLGRAMLLAPVTALPAALVWVVLGVLVGAGLVPPLVASVLAVTTTALVSRALHLDGLADLADGLTSGHDPSRSLEVMPNTLSLPLSLPSQSTRSWLSQYTGTTTRCEPGSGSGSANASTASRYDRRPATATARFLVIGTRM